MKQRIHFAVLFVLLVTCFAVSQKEKTDSTIYQVGGDVKPPKPTSTPVPPNDINSDMKVRLSFVVNSDGSVTNIRLLKRSKSDFDDFAVSTVSKWKFEPATKGGHPVAVRLETEMHSHK